MALQIEKQVGQRSGGGLLTNTGSSIGGVNCAISSSSLGQRAPPNVTQVNKVTSSWVRTTIIYKYIYIYK